jgi:hypothetical protein
MARAETTANGWLDSSSLQTADDGSVYLARSAPQGPVFIISPGGEVRRVMLTTPDSGAALLSVKIAGGKIAAEYNVPGSPPEGHHRNFLTITDLSTGRRLDTVGYEGSALTGVGLVCYLNQSFEFLAYGSDGGLKVVRAVSHGSELEEPREGTSTNLLLVSPLAVRPSVAAFDTSMLR